MTEQNELRQPLHAAPLRKRTLQGAGIAFVLIIIFLLIGGETNPGAPKFWWLLPTIMVPLAGAFGGVAYYMLDHLRYKGGWNTKLANILSGIIYTLLLLIGFVLGMNGPD